MISASPDDICAFCDEWTRKGVDPALTEIGMGRCQARSESERLNLHVGWNATKCVSFRLDRPNLGKRRQYVEQQRSKPVEQA